LEVALPVESGNAAFSFNSNNMANIFASQESYINWVVDNYHDQVVNNAIAAGLITSDIPREELFYVLVEAMKSGGINQVVYSMDVPLNLQDQPQEIRAQFARNVGPIVSPKSYRSDDYTFTTSGEGLDLTDYDAQSGVDNQGFDWDQFSDIFTTAAGVFTQIWGAVSGSPSGPPSGSGNQLPSPPQPPKDNTNLILIIAGIAMVFVLVIVLMSRRK
jgi:hypothetical protein